jgi:hypothetical protein
MVVGAALAAGLFAGCVADPRYGGYRQPQYYDDDYYSDRDRGYDYDRDDHRHGRRRDRDEHDLPTVVCASQDGRRQRCRLDFRISHAEIDKRYSKSRCDYGRTWGYDGNEIWVDKGCRARFRVTRAGRHR